jgi:hypothetical protein
MTFMTVSNLLSNSTSTSTASAVVCAGAAVFLSVLLLHHVIRLQSKLQCSAAATQLTLRQQVLHAVALMAAHTICAEVPTLSSTSVQELPEGLCVLPGACALRTHTSSFCNRPACLCACPALAIMVLFSASHHDLQRKALLGRTKTNWLVRHRAKA